MGVGGNGGGVLILEVLGNLTFGGSSTLTADGAAGTASTAGGNDGGGGGGSGGQIFVLYRGTLTGSPTTTVTGGAGGNGAGDGGNGGAGGAGDYFIEKNSQMV